MSELFLAAVLSLVAAEQQGGQPAQQGGQAGQQGGQAGQQGGREGSAISLNGKWTIVYAKKDGKTIVAYPTTGAGNAAAREGGQTVTIQGNTLTCNLDGKQMTAQLHFGPNGMLRATSDAGQSGQSGRDEPRDRPQGGTAGQNQQQGQAGREQAGQGTKHGVYIATDDFLCLALNEGTATGIDPATGRPGADRSGAGQGTSGQGTTGQGTTGQSTTGQGTTGQGATGQNTAGQAASSPKSAQFILVLCRENGSRPGR